MASHRGPRQAAGDSSKNWIAAAIGFPKRVEEHNAAATLMLGPRLGPTGTIKSYAP